MFGPLPEIPGKSKDIAKICAIKIGIIKCANAIIFNHILHTSGLNIILYYDKDANKTLSSAGLKVIFGINLCAN